MSELPAGLVATSANVPIAVPGKFTERDAELPSAAIVVVVMLMVDAGENANVDPVKLAPVTDTDMPVVPARADLGLTEVTSGFGPT